MEPGLLYDDGFAVRKTLDICSIKGLAYENSINRAAYSLPGRTA